MVAMLSTSLTACGGDDDETRTENQNNKGSDQQQVLSGTIDGHDAVDLGLSVKWATCNVGTSSPSGYGNYYAWGETTTKSSYLLSNYRYLNYKTDTWMSLGNEISGSTYDVAKRNWSSNWRMPTREEFEELVSNCTWTWTSNSGISGYEVTGKNKQSIFLPANGSFYINEKGGKAGIWGEYWSGTYKTTTKFYSHSYGLAFTQSKINVDGHGREVGFAVRPVTTADFSSSNNSETDDDSGSPSTSYEKPNIAFDDYDAYTTSVKVQYRIYNKDKAKVSSAKIYYGTTSNPTASVNASVSGVLITARITGLKKGTTYYVKCKATGKGGTTTTSTSRVQTLN